MENDEHSVVGQFFGGPGYAPAEEVEAAEEAQQLETQRAQPVTVGDVIDAQAVVQPEEPEADWTDEDLYWLEDEPDPLAQVDQRLDFLEEAVQSRDSYLAERSEAEQATENQATNEWVDAEVQEVASQLPRDSIINPAGVLEHAYTAYQEDVQQALAQGYSREEIDAVAEKSWAEWKELTLKEANNAAISAKIFNGPGWGKR